MSPAPLQYVFVVGPLQEQQLKVLYSVGPKCTEMCRFQRYASKKFLRTMPQTSISVWLQTQPPKPRAMRPSDDVLNLRCLRIIVYKSLLFPQ